MQTMTSKIIQIDDNNKINNKLGEYVKEIRDFRGISQHDLGISIGLPEEIAQQTIYKYEKGIIRIPFYIVVKIAKALNIEVIINGDNMIFLSH